jgi:hypothetical protein
VLEGLEAVNWAALGHAYGSAEDVPEWLRALRSPDPEVRQWAHEDWNIVHQGTRYSATAPAVPFLVELATAPDTHDRAWLVNLLAYAAVGNEEAVLPDGVVTSIGSAPPPAGPSRSMRHGRWPPTRPYKPPCPSCCRYWTTTRTGCGGKRRTWAERPVLSPPPGAQQIDWLT